MIAYSLLFDIMIACYQQMNAQYQMNKMVVHDRVIDFIVLNLNELYEVIVMDNNEHNDCYVNLKQYLLDVINDVTHRTFEKYKIEMKDMKNKLTLFAVNCCKATWDILYCQYHMFPLEMYFDDGVVYNE